jgi:aryl-alcohol dehydrogenase-like predicted oxidoreductase
MLTLAETVMKLAAEIGRPPAQIALNWVRQQDARIIPLLRARTAAQLGENLGRLEWELTPDQLRLLDGASRIPLGFPQDYLTSDEVTGLIVGATRPLIVTPA